VAVVGAPPGQREDTASVTGHVKLTRTRGLPLSSNIYQPRAISDRGGPSPEIKSVVVYLKRATFRGTLPVAKTAIRQEREEFVPRVAAITRGSTVEFPNADPIFHNVFSLSSVKKFDLGYYPAGQTRVIKFDAPGVVQVYCHLHPNMYAAIVVVPNRWYARPAEDGTFSMKGIPPGNYHIVTWHMSAGFFRRKVQVPASGDVNLEMNIPVRSEEHDR